MSRQRDRETGLPQPRDLPPPSREKSNETDYLPTPRPEKQPDRDRERDPGERRR